MLNVVTVHDKTDIEQVIDCQRYSSLQRLLNVTVLVLRFVCTLKQRAKNAYVPGEDTVDPDCKELRCSGFKPLKNSLSKT